MAKKHRILFIGEKPSPLAFKKGWTWRDKRLASKTLHDALAANGLSRKLDVDFYNLFGDEPDAAERAEDTRLLEIMRRRLAEGRQIVALGQKVHRLLDKAGVVHVTVRHPAARGAGRSTKVYNDHVKEVLSG
jgi:uracil-DNA glycosylase